MEFPACDLTQPVGLQISPQDIHSDRAAPASPGLLEGEGGAEQEGLGHLSPTMSPPAGPPHQAEGWRAALGALRHLRERTLVAARGLFGERAFARESPGPGGASLTGDLSSVPLYVWGAGRVLVPTQHPHHH